MIFAEPELRSYYVKDFFLLTSPGKCLVVKTLLKGFDSRFGGGFAHGKPSNTPDAAYLGTLDSAVAGRSKWIVSGRTRLCTLCRAWYAYKLNSAHAQAGPGHPSVLVSLERMLCRLTPMRGGTAYHSKHVPTG